MRAKARLALIAVLAVSAMGLVIPSQASALIGWYSCSMKPSGQWCDGRANGTYDGLHSWDYNEAWYPGAWDNTVTACQRLFKPSTNQTLIGWSCSLNATATYYGNQTCVCLEANVLQYSGGPHSINGEANTDF